MSSPSENLKLVLVAREKSGECYYDVSTMALRNKTFYHLLKERMENNWYWVMDNPREKNPNFDEEIRSITELITNRPLPQSIHANAKDVVLQKENMLKDYEESVHWWNRAQKVLSLPEEQGILYRTKNGERNEAELLLSEHIDHEYEGFDIIRIRQV